MVAVALGAQPAALEHRQRPGENRRTEVAAAPAPKVESLGRRAGEAARYVELRFGQHVDREMLGGLKRGQVRALEAKRPLHQWGVERQRGKRVDRQPDRSAVGVAAGG